MTPQQRQMMQQQQYQQQLLRQQQRAAAAAASNPNPTQTRPVGGNGQPASRQPVAGALPGGAGGVATLTRNVSGASGTSMPAAKNPFGPGGNGNSGYLAPNPIPPKIDASPP